MGKGKGGWTRVGTKEQEEELRQKIEYDDDDDDDYRGDEFTGHTGVFSSLSLDVNADKVFFKKKKIKGQQPKKKVVVPRPKPGRHPKWEIPVVKPQEVDPNAKPFKGEVIKLQYVEDEKKRQAEAKRKAKAAKERKEQRKLEAAKARVAQPKRESDEKDEKEEDAFNIEMLESVFQNLKKGGSSLGALFAALAEAIPARYKFIGKLDKELLNAIEMWLASQNYADSTIENFAKTAVSEVARELAGTKEEDGGSSIAVGQALALAAVARVYPAGVAAGLIQYRKRIQKLAEENAKVVSFVCWFVEFVLKSEYPFYARYVWIEVVFPVYEISKVETLRLLGNICVSHYVPKPEEEEEEEEVEEVEDEIENDENEEVEEQEGEEEEQVENEEEVEEEDNEDNEEQEDEEEEQEQDENEDENENEEDNENDNEEQEDENENEEEIQKKRYKFENLPISEMGRNYVKLLEMWGASAKSQGILKSIPALTSIKDIIPERAAIPSKFFKRIMAGGNAAAPGSKCRKQFAGTVADCLVADPLCFDYWILVYHKRVSLSYDVVKLFLGDKGYRCCLDEQLIRALRKRFVKINNALTNGSFVNHKGKNFKIADKSEFGLLNELTENLLSLADKIASNDTDDENAEENELADNSENVEEQQKNNGKKSISKKEKSAKRKKGRGCCCSCCCCCFKSVFVLFSLVLVAAIVAAVWLYVSRPTFEIEKGVKVDVGKLVDDMKAAGKSGELDKVVNFVGKGVDAVKGYVEPYLDMAAAKFDELTDGVKKATKN